MEVNMRKVLFTFLFLIMLSPILYSQRILINEGFENSGFVGPDSIPANWQEYDEDGTNPSFPDAKWKARDSGATHVGVNPLLCAKAHTGRRGMSIPWRAGDPVANDFIFMDSTRIQPGDSLIFWMLFGEPDDISFGGLIDTMQVGYSLNQFPGDWVKIGPTLRSLDSNNVWAEFKYDLSSLSGQLIYIGFRYWMNTTVDGLRICLDDIFVGNRSAIGIQPISTEIPIKFDLKQNYPNPFNPVTNIEFAIAKTSNVNLIVYNSLGQLVSELVNQEMRPGIYRYDFNASNLPSGSYYYRLTAGDFVKTNKMVLVK
jgi:hypothetical protein